MQSLRIGLTLVCLLTAPALACLSGVGNPPSQDIQATAKPGPEQEMLALINRERAKRGLKLLAWDEGLARVARAHNGDMLRQNYFAHVTPQGGTLKERLLAANIPFSRAGENLAFAPNLAIAHRELMRSPGHSANILRPGFQRVGIGFTTIPTGSRYAPRVDGRTMRVPAGTLLITQNFASGGH